MRREPGVAALSVLILALAIGANTAVFSVVNTLLLRPLPFADAAQLAWFSSGRDSIAKGRDVGGLSGVTYTVDAFEEFQRTTTSFRAVTAYDPFLGDAEFTMIGTREPQQVAGVRVASNFFQVLGVRPAYGRFFTNDECRKGGPAAVILSHAFWQRHFNADPAIIGTAVRLGGASTTIVGVMPPDFDFGAVFAPGVRIDAYVPAVMDELRSWGNTLAIVGRLTPGVDLPRRTARNRRRLSRTQRRAQGLVGRLLDDNLRPQGSRDGPFAAGAGVPVGSRRDDHAHRIGQPVEPAAGANGRPQQRVCDAHRAGRDAPAVDRATRH